MGKSVLITSRSYGQVSSEPLDLLKNNGFQVDFQNESFDEEKFLKVIGNYDALIIGAHPFSRKAAEHAVRLKIICKHGVGLDNIDLEAAKEHQIRVTNVPAANANAVADLTFGLMLDVARKISYGAARVKQGLWDKLIGVDVYAKTLGLVGFGTIAKKVAARARGFEMKVLAYDPFVPALPEEFSDVQPASLPGVLKEADFLSIHVPLNEQTRNLIDREQLAMMKKGSILINTARGGIVNETALYEYLKNGHLAGAGLDVTEHEPPSGSPLLTLDNVTIVPHIGMYSKEALNMVSMVCARNVVRMFMNEPLENVVV